MNIKQLEIAMDLNKSLAILSDREKDIIISRYFDNVWFITLGKRYGISLQRVKQIEENALKKLRRYLDE
jgi:RNA polymerase sigma factor (sigma-70 family)